jgi:hypothetical protein
MDEDAHSASNLIVGHAVQPATHQSQLFIATSH